MPSYLQPGGAEVTQGEDTQKKGKDVNMDIGVVTIAPIEISSTTVLYRRDLNRERAAVSLWQGHRIPPPPPERDSDLGFGLERCLSRHKTGFPVALYG